MTRGRAVAALIVTCLIWGTTFPLIKLALSQASPLAFSAARFVFAALLVLPTLRGASAAEWRAGAVLGLLLSLGFAVQTVGLASTTPSRSGFLTALYIPLVPLVVFLVSRVWPSRRALVSLALAVAGMFLLTQPLNRGPAINRGDLLTVVCAIIFAGQLVAVSAYSRIHPLGRLLSIQIVVAGVVSAALVPLEKTPRIAWSPLVISIIVFESIFATILCLHLQLKAQQVLSPTYAAIVFAFEPVVAALASYLIVGDRLSGAQWAGGALIFLGVMLSSGET